MFLQGVGGDAKPSVIGEGVDRWRPGTWALMEQAGKMVSDEVVTALDQGFEQVEPALQSASIETEWPLQALPSRAELEGVLAQAESEGPSRSVRAMWAAKQLERLDRGYELPRSVTLTIHGVQVGRGLRIVGLEGEAVADWGPLIEGFYDGGTTFPLGYTDGTGLYLPVSRMIDEGGYEVVSYWEYGYPAPLAPGMEEVVLRALDDLQRRGVA